MILKVSVATDKLVLEWADEDWGNWSELLNSKDFVDMKSKAQSRLDDAKAQLYKGMGKGKPL